MSEKRSSIETIESFLNCLSDKDRELGLKFLKERKLEELKDLVDSALVIAKRRMLQCKREGKACTITDRHIENINILKSEVDYYYLNNMGDIRDGYNDLDIDVI